MKSTLNRQEKSGKDTTSNLVKSHKRNRRIKNTKIICRMINTKRRQGNSI